MANEIHKIDHGTLWANLQSGTLVLIVDGEEADPINFDDTEAEMQTAIEAAVGSGNAFVFKLEQGVLIVFKGALADTDIAASSVDSSTLEGDADTVTVTTIQQGAPPANERQFVNLNGATTGTFKLNANAVSATVATLDAAGVEAACELIWGSGNYTVTDFGGGFFQVEITDPANTNVENMTKSDDTTDTGVVVNSSVEEGTPGAVQITDVSLPMNPTEGTINFTGVGVADVAFNISAASLQTAINAALGGSYTVTVTGAGTTASPWRITGSDNAAHFFGAEEGSTPLMRVPTPTVTTVQAGAAGGGGAIPITGQGLVYA